MIRILAILTALTVMLSAQVRAQESSDSTDPLNENGQATENTTDAVQSDTASDTTNALQTDAQPDAAVSKPQQSNPSTETESADQTSAEQGDEAQEPASKSPELRVELEETQAIVGQPLSLRVTILVPTWMVDPVVFPSLEMPDVMVRLPERSTSPVSERVDGETWSGVTRHYRIIPLAPGTYTLPPQELVISWADPDTNAPREDRITMEGVEFAGTIPQGAEGLSPFIAAESLELTQEYTGPDAPLSAGDSVERKVTAKVTGTPPMVLPTFIPDEQIVGIAQYPNEPVLTEHEDRGELSGTRVETTTYLAQSGGEGGAPEISISWYNLSTEAVETATLEGRSLAVDAPIASTEPARTPQQTIGLVAMIGAALVLVVMTVVVGWQRYKRHRTARRARYLASEDYAKDQVLQAIKHRNYSEVSKALWLWSERSDGQSVMRDPQINSALITLGNARYGGGQESDAAAWQSLQKAVQHHAKQRGRVEKTDALPPLNPVG
ncbi:MULTISPECIES: hypothetical protein [Halocynthiibacter]|uniref:Protein BatD n=1 Tax=Halocynthiibacter halioticoli TaxID=2986804 RepID=A0AAE3LT52_9RHOB|nr:MULTISPECIES: hypothetical protein [Halocynthiibacter]MCV6824516.1 hypothetical protein [Halocynthiibacter halioticoli]MCW4057517.1 hypothetical protein [Halocynthiibacter sp. SDUM655004]